MFSLRKDHVKAAPRLTDSELDMSGGGLTEIPRIGDACSLLLGYNLFERVACDESMRNLRVLVLKNNRIADISGLSHLKRLETLDLRHNRLCSLREINALTSLTDLNVSSNRLTSLTLPQSLVRLDADNNELREIDLPVNLETIRLCCNPMSSVDISALTNLREIWTIGTDINVCTEADVYR